LVKESPLTSVQENAKRFEVGDWVEFLFGTRKLFAQVAEVRGALGHNGRRLYRVRVPRGADDEDSFELPESELKAAVLPNKQNVLNYLKGGGLVEILRANLGGGRSQPRAWLTYTRRGELSHTYDSARGLIGGSTIPFFALQGDRVFTPKAEEVIDFLMRFGLTHAEAAEVLAAVGATP